VEADHSRLNARLPPMRGLKTIRSLRTIAAGQAFVQNLRRGHTRSPSTYPPTIGSGWRSPSSRYAYGHGQQWLGCNVLRTNQRNSTPQLGQRSVASGDRARGELQRTVPDVSE
jgi:hypothetical protein